MSDEAIRPGTLYVVPTPIGNLGDVTLRALKVLSAVDTVAAEDTRTSKFLLEHFGIQKPLVSFFKHNEALRVPQLLRLLADGKSVALVSDAGTPGISDPAYSIISAALEGGFPVVVLPGPTAFVPALVGSGLPAHAFVFEGFLPHKKGRRARMEALKQEARTVVFYESPHRILRTLEELRDVLGDRKVVVAREISKKFEEYIRGTLSEVHARLSTRTLKGEFVIVLAGHGE